MTNRRTVLKLATAAFMSGSLIPRAAFSKTTSDWDNEIRNELGPLLASAHIINSNDTQTYGIEHAFLLGDFPRYANMNQCVFILQNGGTSQSHPDWLTVPGPDYLTSLFTNRALGEVDLNLDQLASILSGQVQNWSQLGYRSAPIRIAVNGGGSPKLEKLYQKRYATTFRQAGITLENPFEFSAVLSNYRELHEFGVNNEGAILVGLRNVAFNGLLPVSLSGNSLVYGNAMSEYPLRMNAHISVRRSDIALVALNRIVKSTLENHNKDLEHFSKFDHLRS